MKKMVLGLLFFVAVMLNADYIVQIKIVGDNNEKMMQYFKYKDAQHAKIESFYGETKGSEILVVEGKAYSIIYEKGKVVQVVDLDALYKVSNGYEEIMEDEEDEISDGEGTFKWHNTGKCKKVGILEGEVWVASYLDESGTKETMEFVLSKHKLLHDAMEAYEAFLRRISSDVEKQKGESSFFIKPGYTVLQMGEGLFIESIKEEHIDIKEFVIPEAVAAPL